MRVNLAFLQATITSEVGGDEVETSVQETTQNCSCPYRGEYVGSYPHDDDCQAASRAPTYLLEKLDGKAISGAFYEAQLLPVFIMPEAPLNGPIVADSLETETDDDA